MRLLPVPKLIDKIQDYLKIKGDQIKLEVMSQVARALSYAVTLTLLGMIGLFFLLFLYLTLAVYLNDLLESNYLGYLIVSGFILIQLVLVVILLKSGKIQRWLEALILKMSEDD